MVRYRSSSESRSSSAGWRRSRRLSSAMIWKCSGGLEHELTNLEQTDLIGARGKDPLAETRERATTELPPFGFARHPQLIVLAALRARVARRNETDRLALVAPGDLGGNPREIQHVRGGLDDDAAHPRERRPVVSAVQDHFQHRTQPRIGIRDPFERRAVDTARRRRSALQRLLTQSRPGWGVPVPGSPTLAAAAPSSPADRRGSAAAAHPRTPPSAIARTEWRPSSRASWEAPRSR